VVETFGRLGRALINNVHEKNVHKTGTVVKCGSLITKAPSAWLGHYKISQYLMCSHEE
jgi:hypothetical protein